MPDPNERPTASEIRDIASHGGIIDPDDLRGLIRDLAAVVAGQQPSAIVNDINQRLLSLGKRIAALEAPGCEERLKATRIEIPDDYDPREVRAIELHDDALRAEGAAAERVRIRKIAEGLQSKRVATASGDYNDGRYNAYLDIISSTQPDAPAPEGEKAETDVERERREILEMLPKKGDLWNGFDLAIESNWKIVEHIIAAIRERGTTTSPAGNRG